MATCNKCHEGDLEWVETDKGFRLVEADTFGTYRMGWFVLLPNGDKMWTTPTMSLTGWLPHYCG